MDASVHGIRPPPAEVNASPCSAYYGGSFDSSSPPYGGFGTSLPDVVCGYSPSQIRQAYGVAGLVAHGVTGAGESVAVVDAYTSPTLLSDAQRYAQLNDPGHPLLPSQFSVVSSHASIDKAACDASGWFGEESLDVEAVHAVAPGAHIVYVGAKDCFRDLYDKLRMVVDRHLATVVSASWGDNGGDLLDDAGTRHSVDNTLMMAAGTGVSVLVASGDNGDEFSTLGEAAPDYPASSPWATAVGGTTLEIGLGVGERGWSTARSYLCTSTAIGVPGCSPALFNTWLAPSFSMGSGGGTSFRYLQPSYQAGVVSTAMSTRNAAVVGSSPMRVEPDVSMDGDPGTGLLVGVTETFSDGVRYGQYRVGGTSLAAPLFAGIVVLASQISGGPLGFLNPTLYALERSHPGTIVDIGSGSPQAQREFDYANPSNPADGVFVTTRIVDYQGPESYCPASGSCAIRAVSISNGPGYDDMTGLGAPTTGFVQALARP